MKNKLKKHELLRTRLSCAAILVPVFIQSLCGAFMNLSALCDGIYATFGMNDVQVG